MIYLTLILIVLEIGREIREGDPHDLNSNLRVVRDALIVSAYGFYIGSWLGLVSYLVLRFCFFDYIYSYFQYGHIWYLGETSKTDRVLKKINPIVLLLIRNIAILCLIFLYYD